MVFVSAYRFVVLFSYNPSDPSYTYATVCIWSALEIGAGIISANLPLMGPVTGLLLEKAGLKGGLGFLTGNRSTHKNSQYMFGASGIRITTNGTTFGTRRGGGGGDAAFDKTGTSSITTTSKAEEEGIVDVVAASSSNGRGGRTRQLEEYELLALAAPPEQAPHGVALGPGGALAVPNVVCLSTAEKRKTGLVEEVSPGEIRVTREFGHSMTTTLGTG